MKSLRDYINLVEGEQLDELQSLDDLQAAQKAGTKPAAPAKPATANSIPPEVANYKDATPGQEVWFKGTRYKYDPKANAARKPDGTYSFTPGWKQTAAPGDAFQLGGTREKTSSGFTSPELGKQTPPTAVAKAKPDPAVMKIQQDLIAKGATNPDGTPLKADGIMGANTKAAQAKLAAAPAAQAPVAQAAQPAPTAPAAPKGPWPEGSPQDAAWQKLSPEDQKWIGQADPTDQMILARAPNGGKPAVQQGARPAPAATQDMGDGSKITTAPNGQVAATNDDGTPYIPGSNPNLPKNKATNQAAQPAPVSGSNDGSQIATGPNGQVASTDSEGNPYVPGSNPNLPKNKAAAATTPNVNDIVKSKLGETTAFQNDELTRIVSLVQYR